MRNDLRIAIVGGGPVGLMTAILLQQRGACVTVYERDAGPEARINGGTLDLHRNTGQRAMEAAGLLEAFYRLARPTGERSADQHGNVLAEEIPDETNRHDRPEIDRQDLRRLLLSALQPGTVRWTQRFVGLQGEGDILRLRFEGTPEQAADLVIGADGGRSKVRPYITDSQPAYTGTFVIQGEIADPQARCPEFWSLNNRGNLMARGEGMMLFAQTKADRAINYYVSFRQPEHWLAERGVQPGALEGVKQVLHETLSNWHPVYHQAVAATREFAFLPMRRMPPAQDRRISGAITLVGDAAHLMPPFAGVGVNIGLLDAVELADALSASKDHDLLGAIERYERKMSHYATGAQEDTASAEIDIHSDKSFADLLAERDDHHRTIGAAALP